MASHENVSQMIFFIFDQNGSAKMHYGKQNLNEKFRFSNRSFPKRFQIFFKRFQGKVCGKHLSKQIMHPALALGLVYKVFIKRSFQYIS